MSACPCLSESCRTCPSAVRPFRDGQADSPGPRQRTGMSPAAAWLELQNVLADAPRPVPCRTSRTAGRWVSDQPDEQTAAAHACAPCPVRHACLAYALAADEHWSVWGGMTATDRRPLTRKAS